MALSLPEDVEPFLTNDVGWSDPGCYALRLEKHDHCKSEWDRQYDHRPPWWGEFMAAPTVYYIGASQNVMSRLEDHRNGEVRQVSLLQVCDIAELEYVKWTDTPFQDEYNVGSRFKRRYPEAFVHWR